MNFRIGFGYDIHQLSQGEELWLGGIKLEYHLGTVGHSDADVLIHAVVVLDVMNIVQKEHVSITKILIP